MFHAPSTRPLPLAMLVLASAALLGPACSGDDASDGADSASGTNDPGAPPTGECDPGSTAVCDGQCADGSAPMTTCQADRTYAATCTCPNAGNGGGGSGAAGASGSGQSGSAGGQGGGTGGTTAGGTGGTTAGGTGGTTAGGTGGGGTGATGDAGTSQPMGGAAWPMMGMDVNNHYHATSETQIGVDNAGTLEEKWRFGVGTMPPGTPIIAEGKVFVMAASGTFAIDLETGEQVWARDDLAGTASVAYEDGFVYVHAYAAAELYKLNAADGTTVWGPVQSFDLTGCDGTSSPIVGGGAVIVGHSCGGLETTTGGEGSAAGGVEAHSTEDGSKLWTYRTADEGEDGAMVWSSVGIDLEAGVVFASTGNNYTLAGGNSDAIHAIDFESGERLWVNQVRDDDLWSVPTYFSGPDTDFGANPILGEIDGTKFVAAGDKGAAFWVMDRETGDTLWSREGLSASRNQANGGVLMNGAFDGTNFYVMSNDPNAGTTVLLAMNASDGSDAWAPKTFPKIHWGAASVANGVLFAPINDDLVVLNAQTGDELTTLNTGGTMAAGSPAIVDGKVVVASGLTYMYGGGTDILNDQIICYGLP